MSDWALGATNPYKVIHRATCRYAKRPYNHFAGKTEVQVADELKTTGAARWHKAHSCCPLLSVELAGPDGAA